MLQTHPAREELSDLSLGKLPPDRMGQVADHLEACSTCQVAFASLETVDDTLFTALQPGGDTSLDAESALQQGLARIRELGASLGSQVVADEELGTIRDYKLLSRLGAGGMGTVYKALHMQLEKVVALKLLPADRMHPEAVARFKREMKAVGKLHHAHIVQAFDAGEHEGRHFLVMELVDGADLAVIVRQHGPLKIADACEAARQTALALEYVHQHGMVHRDIKPSNLVINTAGQVKVLDLGLARLHDPAHEGDELTSASQAMGTADYLAPEQIGDSHSVDIRADLYALGCTLYKLLTGDAPYADKRTAAQKMVAHLSQPFPDVRAARPEVPAGLKAVLDRLVAKEPDQRYATPAEVATALAPFCAGHDLTVLARVSEHEAFDPPAPTLASATGDPSLDETSTLIAGGAAKPQAKAAIIADGPYLAGSGDWFSGRKLLLALAAGGLALLLGIVVLIQTRSGTLVLKVEGPDDGTPPVIKVDGKTETAEVDKDGKVYRIRVNPGTHQLLVTTPDGTEFGVADKFSMSWGGETNLTARLERREGSPVAEGDPDRRAAEWVLSMDGKMSFEANGKRQDVAEAEELPAGPGKLVSVNLANNQQVTNTELEHLKVATNLTSLDLSGAAVGNGGLKHLAGLTNLRSLNLSGTLDGSSISDAGLVHLKGLTNLTELHLSQTQVSGAGLVHLKRLTNLTQLSLSGTAVTDAGLEHLQGLTNLTHLLLGGTPLSDAGLVHLKGLTNLTELGLSTQSDAGLEHFKGLTKLTHLYLDHGGVSDAGLEHLKGLTNLSELSLHHTKVTAVGVEALRKALPKCNIASAFPSSDPDRRAAEWVLSIGGALEIIDGNARAVHSINELPAGAFTILSADLRGKKQVNDTGLSALAGLKAIETLNLSGTTVTDRGMEQLAGLRNLRWLWLHDTAVTDSGLKQLSGLRKLIRLSVADTEISDSGAKVLASQRGLQGLNLGGTEVTDVGIRELQIMTGLQDLDLRDTHITDAGIADLSGLSSLHDLNLSRTQIGDTGVENLASCKTLARLDLRQTKVTKIGVKKLAAALPQCKIDWDGGVIEPTIVGDSDHRAAEWVLKDRGPRYRSYLTLGVAGKIVHLTTGDQVPVDAFEVRQISISGLGTEESAVAIENLTRLSTTDLRIYHSAGIGDAELAALANHPSYQHLKVLVMNTVGVTAQGLPHIAKFAKLENLVLGVAPVSARELAQLRGLPLKELTMFICKTVDDAAIAEVTVFPGLKRLSLAELPITDHALEHLTKCKTLESLTFARMKFSEAARKKLIAALPGCKITWDGGVIEPTIIADADRRIAESIVRLGGTVGLTAGERFLGQDWQVDGLPEEPFQIDFISFTAPPLVDDKVLDSLHELRGLKQFVLHGQKVTEAGLARFLASPAAGSLRMLSIFQELGDEAFEPLASLHSLSAVSIRARITDVTVLRLADLPVTEVDIHSEVVTDEGLAALKGKQLVRLNLGCPQVDDRGMEALAETTKLLSFGTFSSKIGDGGLTKLTGNAGLTNLSLDFTKVSAAGLDQIIRFPRLAQLTVRGLPVSDKELAKLKVLLELKLLSVAHTNVSEAGVQELARALPNCQITWDGGVIEPKIIADADRRAAEWALSIGGIVDHYGGRQIRKLEDLPQQPFEIASISLRERRIKDDDLQRLEGLTKVSYLDLHACGIGDVGLTHLESLSSLTGLELGGTNVSAAALESLRKLPKLNALYIGHTKFRPSHYQRLKELPALVFLGLGSDPDFGNEEAKSLQKLPAIESLMLNYSNIGDEGLREVARLPSLRQVHLQACPVTGAGLSHLAALPKLQVLDVGLTKVSDEGLEALADYPALEQFLAFQTPISDRGLEHLARAKGLKYLSLSTTGVTAEGIAKLQKALPKCKIEWDGGVIEPTK